MQGGFVKFSKTPLATDMALRQINVTESSRPRPELPSTARQSTLKTCTTTSGWSVLSIMIWDTSIWRPECSNRSKIPRPKVVTYVAGTFCYPSVRAGPTDAVSGANKQHKLALSPDFINNPSERGFYARSIKGPHDSRPSRFLSDYCRLASPLLRVSPSGVDGLTFMMK